MADMGKVVVLCRRWFDWGERWKKSRRWEK